MIKKWRSSALVLLAAAIVAFQPVYSAKAATKTEIVISAAASLKDSLEVIAADYEKLHPDVELLFNYGASGTLQKQIEQGAPADLFLSAGQKQVDALKDKKLVDKSTTLLKNELVLVVPADSKLKFNTVKLLTDKKVKKIAIGQPESVPAGQYAKETLQTREVWDTLSDKYVFAKDVRQVLTYVETGNVEAGFVYKTDALTSSKVRIALRIWDSAHTPILYPAAVLSEAEHPKEANEFYDYLQKQAAQKVFVKYGFTSY
ncbi:molybdate ABC transporter substrate-binding protein [Cohnella faecalis]|uniref:Molybdate ABC transporter substrate-binding protein n=1 Tax=Cohnella faecalis TaxID=2315694 RepID=A0A398CI84_9BACL|nr:molybdate ABC transporter substrate-binding protein [Cohnella faecalis]RIE02160.1 molybdate ABC transporter substrate-binding protein [Cohnella faecalis]